MRCADFYKKWELEPNWCEKTPGAVSQINAYLDLVKEISSRGIERQKVYENFPEGAARIIIAKKDGGRADLLNYVIACLNRDEKITAGDLRGFTFVKAVQQLPVEKLPEPPAQEQGTPDIPWSCSVPCPDGKDHTQTDKIRGKICGLLGIPCNQIARNRCPFIDIDPLTGGKIIRGPPIKITHAPQTIHFTPTEKQWGFIREVMKKIKTDSPEDVISDFVDTMMERMG